MSSSGPDHPDQEPVPIPITWELDLHCFQPCEIKELLPAYLEECLSLGFREVRVIHGKGTGALRETVHALLRKNHRVHSFRLGHEGEGGWGATMVRLTTS